MLKIFLHELMNMRFLHGCIQCNSMCTFPPEFCNNPFRSPLDTPCLPAVWSTVVHTGWKHVWHVVCTAVHPQLCACLFHWIKKLYNKTMAQLNLIIPCLSLIPCTTTSGISTSNIILVYIWALALISLVEQACNNKTTVTALFLH